VNTLSPKYVETLKSPILVALDGSSLSERALPIAVELAARLGADLASVTVLRGTYSDEEIAEDDAMTGMSKTLMAYGAPGTSSIDVLRGDPAEEIVWLSQSRTCRLIVMATHARTGLARGLLGSVTDRVIRSSRVPVLVFSPEAEDDGRLNKNSFADIKTIILGLDGSELAERSLQVVAPIATALGAEIQLVQVLKPQVGAAPTVDQPTNHDFLDAKSYLERLANVLRDRGLSAGHQVLEGYVDEVLVKLSDEIPGSVIALGTRGLSGLKRWTVGSVTDKVTRTSHRPVLVIPPRLAADESAWAPARSRTV
jgi:nucleotide-binding universal stress UspA family protein